LGLEFACGRISQTKTLGVLQEVENFAKIKMLLSFLALSLFYLFRVVLSVSFFIASHWMSLP